MMTKKLVNQTKVFLHWLAVSGLSTRKERENEKALSEVLKVSGEVPTRDIRELHNAFIGGMNSRS